MKANQQRFTDWGEAANHRIVGAGLEEFHDLFVLISSYHQRLRWVSRQRPIWYRQEQLNADTCDRFLGRTPYGKMFRRIAIREARGKPCDSTEGTFNLPLHN